MNKWFYESAKMIKNYSSKSIFYKHLKILTSILLFPFIILNVVIYTLYSTSAEKEIRTSITNTFSKSTNIFETAFSLAENNYLICSSDQYVQNFMLLPTLDHSGIQRYTIKHVTDILSYMKKSSLYFDSIHIYSTINDYVFSTANSNYLSEFYDIDWYDYYKSNGKPQKFMFSASSNNVNTNILSLGYEFYYNKEVIGIIVFNIDMEILSQLALGTEIDKEVTYIFNNKNELVYSSDNTAPAFHSEQDIHFDKNGLNQSTYGNIYAFSRYLDAFDCLITTEYDIAQLQRTKLKTSSVLFILIVLSVILAFSISVYMSFHFYNSISAIMASFSSVGTPLPSNNPKSYNEIKFITDNILMNSLSKSKVEEELTKKMLHLQKAQTIALQTQFTPHFLFNTLNHISVTLMNTLGHNNSASRMITILAKLLSIALDTKEYTTSIKNEVAYAKKYIELEQIKHNNNFDVKWDIDEELYCFTTPKLILQPILENSLKHGINPLRNERRGKIIISLKRDGNDILFSISDNGNGITDEHLIEVRERLKNTDIPETHHIGLCNVHQRIQLLFKENYGCNIYRGNPGLTVTIRLPCEHITYAEETE